MGFKARSKTRAAYNAGRNDGEEWLRDQERELHRADMAELARAILRDSDSEKTWNAALINAVGLPKALELLECPGGLNAAGGLTRAGEAALAEYERGCNDALAEWLRELER